jgi:glucuronoarabinoxylan endo-1,4-beta-xylanase
MFLEKPHLVFVLISALPYPTRGVIRLTLMRHVSISFLAALLSTCCVQMGVADSQITLYPKEPLQRIDGFGASDAWYASDFRWYSPDQQTRLLNSLFSTTTGAGLSLLRHRIPPEIEPSAGVWDWTQDSDTVWLTQQAVARGVSKVWSTAWSPPAWMKTNQNVDNGGALATNHYQDYATFLATYVQHYASAFGVNIAGVSIANEPDQTQPYESSNWTSQQFHDFIANNLIPTFQTANLKTQVIMPEFSGWSDALAAATLADPVTANFVSIIASHDYWLGLGPFTDAQSANKTVWETEVSNLGTDDPTIADGLNWAQVIHHTLVDAQANAWHYWWLYSDVSDTSGQSLISGDPSTNSFTTKKRLWTIGNFSRFVRPGSHMLSLSSNNPEGGVYITAFIGPDKTIAIVAINANASSTTLTVNTNQQRLPSVFEYRTSATENLRLAGLIPVRQQSFKASLAPQSVTTLCLQPTGLRPPR